MLEVNTYRSGSGGDVVSSHTGGDLSAGGGPGGTGRWLSPTRFIVAAFIVACAVIWLVPTLIRARKPAEEASCMAHLKQVGFAMSMYADDYNGRYPLTGNWHEAVRTYVDDPADPHMRVKPGSRMDPLKCPCDPSASTVSYLYMSRGILDYTMARLGDSVTPLAVDEYFHRKTTLVYYDGHVDKIEKTRWAYERLRQWKVRRDLDDPASYAYELLPGTQARPSFAAPVIEPTERYIWPEF